MPAILGTYGGNAILDHSTGRSAMPFGSKHVSLHSGNPGLNGANELGYSGYERKQPAPGWNAASDGVPASNDGEILYPVTDAPVTITYVGIWDAESGGNFILGFAVPPRLIPAGKPPKIPDGALQIIGSGDFSDYLKPRIVNHMLGISEYTMPTAYLGVIDDNGDEFAGSGYARSETDFDPADGKEIENADEEDFGTAEGDLGITEGWALFDDPASGNALVFGLWSATAEILNGDGYLVPENGLRITAV